MTQFIMNKCFKLEIHIMVNRDLCQNITSAFVQIIYQLKSTDRNRKDKNSARPPFRPDCNPFDFFK